MNQSRVFLRYFFHGYCSSSTPNSKSTTNTSIKPRYLKPSIKFQLHNYISFQDTFQNAGSTPRPRARSPRQERLLDCQGATLRRRPVQTSPSSASLPISLQTVGAGPSSPPARPASLGHWCMVVVGAGTRCHRRRHGQVMAGAREGRGGAARGRRAHRNG